MYSIGELARMAGVSRRTLQFYDQIGLLPAGRDPNNGYRRYSEADALRLQQIMLYREMDMPVVEIRHLLDAPDFSTLSALRHHRERLKTEHDRLGSLLRTVESTLNCLEEGDPMSSISLFDGFSEARQVEYEREATQQWDADLVKQSNRRWRSYSDRRKKDIVAEGDAIYRELAERMRKPVTDAGVQALVARWHRHLEYFYQPSVTMLRGLGEVYVSDQRFTDNIDRFGTGLSVFLNEAIQYYCDQLTDEDV